MNNSISILAIIFCFLLASCEDDAQEIVLEQTELEKVILEDAHTYFDKLGYEPSSLHVSLPEETITIDGDMQLSFEDLSQLNQEWELMDDSVQASARVYHRGTLHPFYVTTFLNMGKCSPINSTNNCPTQRNIVIGIDYNVSSSWVAAFDWAIAELNSLGLYIKYSRFIRPRPYSSLTTKKTTQDTYVQVADLGSSVVADAKIGNGGVGYRIRVNVNPRFDSDSQTNRNHTALHEILHTLGFYHGNSNDGHVIGSDALDYRSVINSGNRNVRNGLTVRDIEAIRFYYEPH
ncbi:MAG: M57 family metalloprotease [Reichenbachiella sp.]